MPPQLPASRVKPSSSSLSAAGGGKRPSLLSVVSSPTKKIARPTSAPCLAALSASMTAAPAPKKIAARPMPPVARPRQPTLATPHVAGPREPPPQPSSKIVPKKPARPAAAGSSLAPPCRAAESVHPARRLACGTAVYVRTRYVMITERCCLLIWLPARVVSASDAYHCTVKYAADLHAMFASKVVRVPVADVREAPPSRRQRHGRPEQEAGSTVTARSVPAKLA